jgi:uncharacterized protein YjiS (DUF1127 family)
MSIFHSIPTEIREIWLTCIGSPDSRTRQLAALRSLDAHLLSDIGLTPEQVHAAKALADLPRPSVRLEMGQAYLSR